MDRRTGRDVGQARGFLHDLAASTGLEGFAHLCVDDPPRLVRSELATLSACDLTSGRRYGVGAPADALSPGDSACFDRHFFELVSSVLNRAGHDFTDAERDVLDVARTWLSAMYRNAIALDRAMRTIETLRRELADRSTGDLPPEPTLLTAREREVLRWVGAGKSNVQIATILGTSPRTVQKHLEHVYVKLGVENRLAAVLRVGRDERDGPPRARIAPSRREGAQRQGCTSESPTPGSAGVRQQRKSAATSAAKGRQR
jgi:DNA-binding CsgD family transcriptional regulator